MANNRNQSQFMVVDLFAGVGGLSYGFAHRSQFQVLAANEILPAMAEAYRLNHPDVQMFDNIQVRASGVAVEQQHI